MATSRVNEHRRNRKSPAECKARIRTNILIIRSLLKQSSIEAGGLQGRPVEFPKPRRFYLTFSFRQHGSQTVSRLWAFGEREKID
jgi:hypothetical protein